MKIKRWIPSLLLAACLVPFGGIVSAQNTQTPPKKFPKLLLLSPVRQTRLTSSTAQFFWKLQDREPSFHIKHFELQIWDKKKRFRTAYTITPRDTNGYGSCLIFDTRQVFKRHGKYYWKVLVIDSTGNQLTSITNSFFVPAPRLKARIPLPVYPFALRYQYNHWLNFAEYRSFIGTLYPKSHMQSYSDVSLGFHQTWGETGAFELHERLLLLSQIGLGAEITPRIRLFRNPFIALMPWGRVKQCWYSTGLQNDTGTLMEAALGCDFSTMPGGNIVLFGAWIPMHRVRYGLRNDGPHTLEGRGFEAGILLTMPKSILANVKFLGMDIDFQRIPVGIVFGRIKDDHTGIHMDYRRFTIEYLF
jgi:hypothetical protein